MNLAIEIQDTGLLVRARPALTPVLPPSPGYALIERGSLRTGVAARARARLQPKQVDNQFWNTLDTEPLAGAPGKLSAADLAHAHLSGVWEQVQGVAPVDEAEVLLVLPGSYTDEQLGLVLGIARACGMRVTGMVDAAVAATAGSCLPPGCRHLLHLDLQLHQSVVTALEWHDGVRRRNVEVSRRLGLVSLYQTWTRRVARAFVHATRFDPLHGAATEQALYDRLPAFLEQLTRRAAATFTIQAGATPQTVELTRADLVSAAEADLEAILQLLDSQMPGGRPTVVLLSHQAAMLPGLRQRLSERGEVVVVDLPAGAAATAALAQADHIRAAGEALPFVTRLPAPPRAVPDPPAVPVSVPVPEPASMSPTGAQIASVASQSPPTHILHQGRAYPLAAPIFVVGTAIPAGQQGLQLRGPTDGISRSHCSIRRTGDGVVVVDHSTCGSFLNEQRIDGQQLLAVGDRLRLGRPGLELLLIHVEDG